MTNKAPLVSVIMTVYNGEEYLAQAIASIRQQSMRDLELVIVDDGSNDNTPQILEEAQCADQRIKVISRPHLGLRAHLLNLAIAKANGSYIAILDADDWAESTRLEKQFAFLQEHKDVGLLGTACKYLHEETGRERITYYPLSDPELRRALVRRNPFAHSSIMVPRYVMQEIGGYNELFHLSEDYELYVRIACKYKLANLPEVLTARRVHHQAHFRYKASYWKKRKIDIMIRRQAWYKFSRQVSELRFVFIEPVAKSLYVYLMGSRIGR